MTSDPNPTGSGDGAAPGKEPPMEPAFLSRSMTADGRHVVAWSTGSISPSRLVANYRGAHKGPARYHDADAKAALQLIEIAGAVELVDLIAAIPGTRERWRNRASGGELPTASQALAECDHCRSFRLTHADPDRFRTTFI